MKLIKQKIEILDHSDDLLRGSNIDMNNITEIIYGRSKNYIIDAVYDGPFEDHNQILEHCTVYLKIKIGSPIQDINYMFNIDSVLNYRNNKYSIVKEHTEDHVVTDFYITTNYRVLAENDWLEDLKFECKPTKYHEKRFSVRFICDFNYLNSILMNDSVLHSSFSFIQEKIHSFDNIIKPIKFIIPDWLNMVEGEYKSDPDYPHEYIVINNGIKTLMEPFKDEDNIIKNTYSIDYFNTMVNERNVSLGFLDTCCFSEEVYYGLINEGGCKPEQARTILPNNLKTEFVITGFISDWEKLLDLISKSDDKNNGNQLLIDEFVKKGLYSIKN